MDQLGGDGGRVPLEQWFWEMPICTRWWTAATVLTSVLVQCDMVTPWQLFYSYRAVFVKHQFWRLLTTFLYFGPLSLDLLFHVYFQHRYSRLLEEAAGRSPAQFSWMLLYASGCLILLSPLVKMPFLGPPLSSTLVYIWSRRNPEVRLSFLGLLVFTAPYLPWVLMAFSLILHGSVPKDEIMGIAIGHVYYFFSDVYPPLHGGSRPLDPPAWYRAIFEGWPRRRHDHDHDHHDDDSLDEDDDQDQEILPDDDTANAINNDLAAARAELAPPHVR